MLCTTKTKLITWLLICKVIWNDAIKKRQCGFVQPYPSHQASILQHWVPRPVLMCVCGDECQYERCIYCFSQGPFLWAHRNTARVSKYQYFIKSRARWWIAQDIAVINHSLSLFNQPNALCPWEAHSQCREWVFWGGKKLFSEMAYIEGTIKVMLWSYEIYMLLLTLLLFWSALHHPGEQTCFISGDRWWDCRRLHLYFWKLRGGRVLWIKESYSMYRYCAEYQCAARLDSAWQLNHVGKSFSRFC